MKDSQKLLEELQNRAIDPEHEQALSDLCEELLQEFENGSSEAVTGLLRFKIEKLRSTYNQAYRALTATMGL